MTPHAQSRLEQPNLALHLLHTTPLLHEGDCTLLGIDADGQLYVEEAYGSRDETFVAYHIVNRDGVLAFSVDENDGQHTITQRPDDGVALTVPRRAWATMALNHAGARYRGLRAEDRIDDLVQPMSLMEKSAVIEAITQFSVTDDLSDLSAFAILGISESYVLAEAILLPPSLYLVCRRLRLAYALPELKGDSGGQPYDYDTLTLYIAHPYDVRDDNPPPLSACIGGCLGVPLFHPMNCLIWQDRVYFADAGDTGRVSAIRIAQLPFYQPPLSLQEQLRRRLYG